MLSKTYSLRSKRHFDLVYRNPRTKSFYSEHLKILFLSADIKLPKLAFVISKKNGKAHDRNLMRRWLKQTVQNELKSGVILSGYYLIIVRKPSSDFPTIQSETQNLLGKVGN